MRNTVYKTFIIIIILFSITLSAKNKNASTFNNEETLSQYIKNDDTLSSSPLNVEERGRTLALKNIKSEISTLKTKLTTEQKKLYRAQANGVISNNTKTPKKETASSLKAKEPKKKSKATSDKSANNTKTKIDHLLSLNSENINVTDIAIQISNLEDQLTALTNQKNKSEIQKAYATYKESEKNLNIIKKFKYPEIRPLLENIIEINKKNITNIISIYKKDNFEKRNLATLNSRLAEDKVNFELTKQRITMLGLNRKMGKLLQHRRAMLQKNTPSPLITRNRQLEIIDANLKSDLIYEKLQNLPTEKYSLYSKIGKLGNEIPKNQYDTLTSYTYLIIKSYKEILLQTASAYTEYIKTLNEIQKIQKELENISGEYRDYINQKLLWIPSTNMISLSDIYKSKNAILWFLQKSNWTTLANDFIFSLSFNNQNWILIFLLLIAIFLIIFSAKKRNIQSSSNIYNAFIYHLALICISSGLYFMLYLISHQLSNLKPAYLFTQAFSFSISIIMLFLFALNALKTFYINNIFTIPKHLQGLCDDINNSFKPITKFALSLLIFIAVLIQNGPLSSEFRNTLGRITFIGVMCLLLILFRKLFIKNLFRKESNKNLNKHNRVISAIILFTPSFLIFLAVTGYYFTAYQISNCIWRLFCLTSILLIACTFINKIIQAVVYNINLNNKNSDSDGENLSNEELYRKTTQLISYIFSLIWCFSFIIIISNLIPVLKHLDSIVLWHYNVINGSKTIAVNITLLGLIKSLITFIFTCLTVKNFSIIFNILNIRKIVAHPGSRHAVELIFKYLTFSIGFFYSLVLIGITWGQIQYIAAAMTIGLSFGLQDIFANFVSGIIILFEKPIRIGDVISVSGYTGTVTKIKIRSTTITDIDRHELIIPNKSFLTANITNWSLSDHISRVVIDVSIGLESDTEKAEKLLLQIARNNELVQKKPEPSVVFSGFGDSSLDFSLIIFTDVNSRTEVQHRLRHEINSKLKENNIESKKCS